MTQYWGGGTKHFFLLILYNFKNIGGGGARAPPAPPASLLRGPCESDAVEDNRWTESNKKTPNTKLRHAGTTLTLFRLGEGEGG